MRRELTPRIAYACVVVLSYACATRASRPAPAEEPRLAVPAATPATTTTTTAPAEPPPAPPSEPPPRLPWVNPARCAIPCTYDPKENLVRVDDRGAPDPAGHHLVQRSIQAPLHDLVAAAHAAGHKLRIESAFRSYEEQDALFRRTKQIGRAARPGHSEHQLGTAVDFRLPSTAAIAWLAAHATDHGFALSYPDGKQRTTGYRPEPWHVRYLGPDLATELHAKGSSLEELFRARPELGESGSCDDCPLAVSRTACDGVPDTGRCTGTVLEWCYDGALAAVDCAAFKQRCGRAKSSAPYDCIAK